MGKTILPIQQEFRHQANKKQAQILMKFFKTGPGEYGEGDLFLGIKVPVVRAFVKDNYNVSYGDITKLLSSEYHEERLLGILIVVKKSQTGTPKDKKQAYQFYMKNLSAINNWDLVDLSAPQLVGEYLQDKSRSVLYKLIKSKNIWRRRVAIVATHTFIRNGDFADTLELAEQLLIDKHDLMHKAVGWMLREVGKRNKEELKKFLDQFAFCMPRTMLRYSIEHFSKREREHYMKLRYVTTM